MKNPVRRIYRNMKHARGMKEARLRNIEQSLRFQQIINDALMEKIMLLEANAQ